MYLFFALHTCHLMQDTSGIYPKYSDTTVNLFTLKTAASENIDSLKSGNGAIEK